MLALQNNRLTCSNDVLCNTLSCLESASSSSHQRSVRSTQICPLPSTYVESKHPHQIPLPRLTLAPLRIQPQSLDLLCFPEMAFSGYVFENAAAITPYLEHPRTGTTSVFCSDLAKKLKCYVLAGFPEILSPTEDRKINQVGANSAAFYGPDGEWVGGYRKTHLYETDLTWAKPGVGCSIFLSFLFSITSQGTGFATFTLPSPLQTITLGICMDLNPQIPEWTRAHGPYEIADHCISTKSNILILLNAWLDSQKEPEETHDWSTLNYWALRTRPLWSNGSDSDSSSSEEEQDTSTSDPPINETLVVVCNRTGHENGQPNSVFIAIHRY